MKATRAADVERFMDIPNVGPRMAADFAALGLKKPGQLRGKDPMMLYKRLCRISGSRQDPCVLDTFIAVIDFMNGAKPRPWWAYTAARKKRFPKT